LEGTPEVDDERMLDGLEHALLVVGVLDLFGLVYLGFTEDFDRIEAKVVFAPDC
jgi:hypothetical protein